MVLTKEIISLACSAMISNMETGGTYQRYEDQHTLVSVARSSEIMHKGCMMIAQRAQEEGVEVSWALAVGLAESGFDIGEVSSSGGNANIGLMQVKPKVWCKLQSTTADWKSRNEFQDSEVCDLERAGVYAIKVNVVKKGNPQKLIDESAEHFLKYYQKSPKAYSFNPSHKDWASFQAADVSAKKKILIAYYTKLYKGTDLTDGLVSTFCHYNAGTLCSETSILRYARKVRANVSYVKKKIRLAEIQIKKQQQKQGLEATKAVAEIPVEDLNKITKSEQYIPEESFVNIKKTLVIHVKGIKKKESSNLAKKLSKLDQRP